MHVMDNVFENFADITFASKGHLFFVLYVFDREILPICYYRGR